MTTDSVDDDKEEGLGDHLVRNEGLITDLDLRVDAAEEVRRTINGDAHVSLHEKKLNYRGDLVYLAGERDRQVVGRYERYSRHSEIFSLSSRYQEKIYGPINYHIKVSADVLMAGAYSCVNLGAFLRICAWADGMVWGGWLDADLTRIELFGVALRSEMLYAHVAGFRGIASGGYVDDWLNRFELYGIELDSHVTRVDLHSPGSGEVLKV